jgi:hypothetical protein
MEKGKDIPEAAGGTASKVPYNRANINKCRCSQCPVQADSQCVKQKIKNSKKEMATMPSGEVPPPEEIPGIYCSTGKATCQDLDPSRQCMCGACEVWYEYNLKDADPDNHFCHNGRAI